ncbi:unnamed protein product, partial [Brugia timori]|uniref:Virion protein 1 n=1 Tax=Brugia timori TaxID=42155 RepID=A0A0R3R1K1_9BILA
EGTPRLTRTNEQSSVTGGNNYHETASRTTGTVIDSAVTFFTEQHRNITASSFIDQLT